MQAAPSKPFSATTAAPTIPSGLGRITIYNNLFQKPFLPLFSFAMNWNTAAVPGKTQQLQKLWRKAERFLQIMKEVMVSFLQQLQHPLIFCLLYHFPQFCRIAAVIIQSLSSALSLTAWRWARMRKTLLGAFILSQPGEKRWVTSHLRVKGHFLQGFIAFFCPLAANRQWAALTERFLYPLAEKKRQNQQPTTELTRPVKIHDSGKSLRIK